MERDIAESLQRTGSEEHTMVSRSKAYLQLHSAPLDLIDEMQSLAELYEARAQSKAIGFRYSISLGERCWVRANAVCLRQVLHNLLDNAVKFTSRGLVQFTVHPVGGLIVFEVVDTGSGIADEDLPKIFKVFHQTDARAARPAEGTGLGLTIARELAHAMGGEIGVKSAVGVGTRFALAVKLDRVPEGEIPAERFSVRRGYRILLVEDNDVNANIATAHLENLGVRTTRAADRKQAVVAAFGRERPDLILMDCRTSVMDGTAATSEIRMIEKAGGLPRVPIVALKAVLSEDDKRECFEAGMDGFLMKPFTDAQLQAAIREYALVESRPVFS